MIVVLPGLIGDLKALIGHELSGSTAMREEPFAAGEKSGWNVLATQIVDDVTLIAGDLVWLLAKIKG